MALGPARVRDAAFFGTHVRVHATPLTAPETVLTLHLPPEAEPQPGTVLDLFAQAHSFLEE